MGLVSEIRVPALGSCRSRCSRLSLPHTPPGLSGPPTPTSVVHGVPLSGCILPGPSRFTRGLPHTQGS